MVRRGRNGTRGCEQVPNLITAARIILAPSLLFVPLGSAAFWVVYLLCGLSDMLDGWLARRMGSQTRLGARLDSTADLVVIVVLLWRLWPVILSAGAVVAWIAAVTVLRLGAGLAAYIRHGVFGFLHTHANRLTGLLLFLYPLSLSFTHSRAIMYALCALATGSAAEELVIELTSPEWDPDRRSIAVRRP